MSPEPVKNVAASIKNRLMAMARQSGKPFQSLFYVVGLFNLDMLYFCMLPSNSSAMHAFSSRMMLSSARPKLNRLMLPYQTIF